MIKSFNPVFSHSLNLLSSAINRIFFVYIISLWTLASLWKFEQATLFSFIFFFFCKFAYLFSFLLLVLLICIGCFVNVAKSKLLKQQSATYIEYGDVASIRKPLAPPANRSLIRTTLLLCRPQSCRPHSVD